MSRPVLSRVAKLVRADSCIARVGGRFAKRTMVGSTVAVVLLGASVFPTRAMADQVAATDSQIHNMEAQVASGAARIRALTLAYEQSNLNAESLSHQVTADQQQINQLRSEEAGTRVALERDAITSYTGGLFGSEQFGTNSANTDPSIRAAYFQMAVGDVSEALDQYRSQEQQIGTATANLVSQQKAARQAVSAIASARQEALSEASSEQTELTQLQSQLSRLIAAAALAARQRPAPATQGVPVNNGLVSVVKSIVTPSPTPTAAPTRAPAPTAPTPAPTPTPTSSPPPTTPPPTAPPPVATGGGGAGGVWLELRECESGNNYQENTGNGFYGAYQFAEQTWSGLGYPGRPDLEPPAMQDQAAMKLQAEDGWGPWPACSAALGL